MAIQAAADLLCCLASDAQQTIELPVTIRPAAPQTHTHTAHGTLQAVKHMRTRSQKTTTHPGAWCERLGLSVGEQGWVQHTRLHVGHARVDLDAKRLDSRVCGSSRQTAATGSV